MLKKILSAIALSIISFNVMADSSCITSYSGVVDKILPSVVSVSVSKNLKEGQVDILKSPNSPFDDLFKGFLNDYDFYNFKKNNAIGSGFIIDPSGIVMTNYHVIEDADIISVILNDNVKLRAKLIGSDKKTDIALIKIETTKQITAVKLGDSDNAKVGDIILAVGNPYGLGNSVTTGIISARSRDINSGPYDDFIQTDASINQGNSGGPMFNLEGEVIGINTAIFSPSGGNIGIGFAIPSNNARWVAENLIKYGKIRRGALGVKIQEISDEIAESMSLKNNDGVLVASVDDNSAAKIGGVKVGDVIIKYDGFLLQNPKQLSSLVAKTEIDKVIKLEVIRAKKDLTLEVKIKEMEENFFENAFNDNEKTISRSDEIIEFGLHLKDLDKDLRQKYSIKEDKKGVFVTDVDKDSLSYEKGIKSGDLILELGQKKVSSVKSFIKQLQEIKKSDKQSVLLLIENENGTGFIALKLN